MRYTAAILFILAGFVANAQQSITAIVTVTNAPSVGATLTNASDVRTWTNSLSATTIQTNATIGGSGTNLYTSLVSYGAANVLAVSQTATNAVTVFGKSGSALSYGLSVGWGTVTYTTNTATNSFALRIPYAVETTTNREKAATNIIDLLRAHATSGSALATDGWLTNFVNRTAPQAITGPLALVATNTANILYVTNLQGIANGLAGTLGNVTNTNATILTLRGGNVIATNLTAPTAYAGTIYATNLFSTNLTVTNLTMPDGTALIKYGTTNIFANGVFSNVVFAGTHNYTNALAYHMTNVADYVAPSAGAMIYSTSGSIKYLGTGDGVGLTNSLHNSGVVANSSGSSDALANSVQAVDFGGTDPSIALPGLGKYLIIAVLTVGDCTAADDVRAQLYSGEAETEYFGQEYRVSAPGTGRFQIVLMTQYTSYASPETISIHAYNGTAARGNAYAEGTTITAVRLH
jgi:hypothetical protein